MRREDDKSCLSCDYWMPNYGESEPYHEMTSGECRRRPPSVPLIAERGQYYERTEEGSTKDTTLMGWPETFGLEWCGEWSPDFDAMCKGMS